MTVTVFARMFLPFSSNLKKITASIYTAPGVFEPELYMIFSLGNINYQYCFLGQQGAHFKSNVCVIPEETPWTILELFLFSKFKLN